MGPQKLFKVFFFFFLIFLVILMAIQVQEPLVSPRTSGDQDALLNILSPSSPHHFASLILLSEPNSYCEIPIICHLICVVFPGFPNLMCSVLPYSEHNHAHLWGAWEG